MDSQVLRPIITEFHWDVWAEEGGEVEEDGFEEEDGSDGDEEEGGEPVVAE